MKLLIIGVGSIGKRHFMLIKEHFPEVQVVCHEPAPDADTVFICNPTEYHIDTAIKCIQEMPNLRNILCEKPLDVSSRRLPELKGMIGDRIFYLAYPLRFNPVIQDVKNNYAYAVLDLICHSDSTKWPSKRELNHVLLELSHEVDLAYYLNGSIEKITSVVNGNKTKALLRVDHVSERETYIDLDMRSKKEQRLINLISNRFNYQVSNADYLAQLRYFFDLCDTRPKRHMNDLTEASELFCKLEECIK